MKKRKMEVGQTTYNLLIDACGKGRNPAKVLLVGFFMFKSLLREFRYQWKHLKKQWNYS